MTTNGFNWKQQDEDGETSLHLAILDGSRKVVEILLSHYTPEDKNGFGETLFGKSLATRQTEIALMLLNSGFYNETENRKGLFPLDLATLKGNEVLLKMLVKLPRGESHKNPFNGKTALITAT